MAEIMEQYGTFIYLGIFVVIFYVFLIRPQQKQQKARAAMIEALVKGDKVVNHGGVIGTIVEVKDDRLVVQVADKMQVQMLKEGVARVMGK